VNRIPFEQVVTQHGPTVLRVCRAVLGRDDAEDAWSETFVAALRAYPDLPADANVEAWLVTIAKHKAIDQHRASARRPVPVDQLPERLVENPPDLDDALWPALADLPRKQREAIAYHHLAGLPYAQVAKLLGNSEAAARRAAADGMRTLRATLRAPRQQGAFR
jgi:RNA polymerase sigma factor (sigma-70 family)